ncbi:MAG: glycosyltransferase family 39 protein, partial [Candidatus Acidiferrum sp.]
ALSFKLFGVSEAAARLPSALSALFATLALAWLALRMYGAETARWLLLLLPTTVGMIGFSHAAASDMPFSGMLTIAIVCAAVALRLVPATEDRASPNSANSPTPWTALILFGFFLGLAVLAKGPAGIILCGGAVFFWAIFTKRWRDAFRLLHPAAIAAFCITALPWYILCARRNPDFFRVFIIEHNFKRYLTPEFQHIQPFWYYVPVTLVTFLPWTGAVLWASAAGVAQISQTKRLRTDTAFLFSWILFVMLFFTLSKSKLPGYVLPAVPALALILARACTTLATDRRRLFGATIAASALLYFGVSQLGYRTFTHVSTSTQLLKYAVIFLLVLFGISNTILAVSYLCGATRRMRNLVGSFAVVPVLFAFLITNDLGSAPLQISARTLASQLWAHRVPPDHLFVYHGMSRSFRYGLSFYLHQDLPDWSEKSNADVYVISGSLDCSHLEMRGFNCVRVLLSSSAGDWFVSHLTPTNSPPGPASSRQPQ